MWVKLIPMADIGTNFTNIWTIRTAWIFLFLETYLFDTYIFCDEIEHSILIFSSTLFWFFFRLIPYIWINVLCCFQGHDYSSGVWQFEGQGYVPCGTSGVSIMQVFGSDPPHATTLMVRTYNGSLSYYRGPVLVQNIWDRWFYLNVIHDVEACNVKVYVDGVLVLEAPGRGGSSHYFKFGVYAQNDPSYYMESRWKGIRVLKKCSWLKWNRVVESWKLVSFDD